MRLLQLDSHGRLRLTEDLPSNDIPPYAILSHTWGDGEVTLQDLVDDGVEGKVAYEEKRGCRKIRFCANQAQQDGFAYFWVDTCCIDKTNNVELSEAINSMFRWYREAARCYVYLSDVSHPNIEQSDSPGHPPPWETEFCKSRWFTRGWTLQELIAPSVVQFFSCEGMLLGDKASLQQQIHNITGIPTLALRGAALDRFDVKERFRWAEGRQTTREEDWAYSLLGIFGVFIPPIYGEGKSSAIQRLRREVNNPHPKKHRLPARM
jgi:hypothetical protein